MTEKEQLYLETEQEHKDEPGVQYRWLQTRRRMYCTIFVLGIALILMLAAGLMAVTWLGLKEVGSNESNDITDETDSETPCLTESCVKLSALILSGVDPTIDPCQDFYNFSCGLWQDNNYVPDDVGEFGAFDILTRENLRQMDKILTNKDDDDIEAVLKAKEFYQLCLKTNFSDVLGPQSLLKFLSDTGGWPLLGLPGGPWNINSSQFFQEKLVKSPAFFTVDVDENPLDLKKYIISITQSGLSLSYPGAYNDTASVDQLRTMITKLLQGLVPGPSYTEAANGIIKVETALANIFDDDTPSKPITVAELTEMAPYFNWTGRLQDIFATVEVKLSGDSELVSVLDSTYLEKLTDVLPTFDNTTLQNYARWQLVLKFVRVLGQFSIDAYYDFQRATSLRGPIPQKEMTCITVTQQVLPLAIWRPFADFVLPKGAKSNGSQMTTDAMAAFRERLAANTWLDDVTRRRCEEKIDLMGQIIAYPNDILNDSFIDRLYSGFKVYPDDLFHTFLDFLVQSLRNDLANLREPVNLLEAFPDPFEVNAFYAPPFNTMIVLPGIMNSPFFEPDWPAYFRYGALGLVTGHEITHGFDNNGRKYNETGQLSPWWTNASIEAFNERAKCYVEQYSKYELFGIHINGEQTLGENIADNGGIRVAFRAYEDYVAKKGTDPLLPAIPYSRQQIFFIAFAQLWCTYYTEAAFKRQVMVDVHSPGPIRVIGAASNSPDFAKAFNCPAGSPMNPKNKCALW